VAAPPPQQRPERLAEAVVALLARPFDANPFRTVADYIGVRLEIERYNDILHGVTRTVMSNFGIEEMLTLNA
jgi:hypothetical protein